jgi:hypothetical protein
MSFYPNSSIVGADFNATNTTAQFALGTTAIGSANTEWVYVYMSGAASAGNCVVVSQTGTAAAASIALAMNPVHSLAFAQMAFAAADFGWVAKKGAITVEMSATTVAVTTALYVGTTAGHLSTTVGSATVFGVQVTGSSATATAWTTTGTVTWPRVGDANLSNS